MAAPALFRPFETIRYEKGEEGDGVCGGLGKVDGNNGDGERRLDAVRAGEDAAECAASTSAKGPEEVWILAFIGSAKDTVRGDKLVLYNAVDAEAVNGAENGVSAALNPAAGDTHCVGVGANEGHILLFSVSIDLVEVGSCTCGNGIVGCMARRAAFRNKRCIAGKTFEVPGPQC